jgi:5-hydroxyisourate hydrolase-like protein (transthyretin family)
MNGKEMKIILPIAVIAILILSVLGVALMSGPDDSSGPGKVEPGPYTMSVGPITDDEGTPIMNAIVTLRTSNGTIATAVTNSDGIAEFSIEEKIEAGEYELMIDTEGFEEKVFEVSLDYNEDDETKIELSSVELEAGNITIEPKQLPPLEFSVGPIWGAEELLSGVAIELRLDNEMIVTEYTNENGTATFTFATPPEDGTYVLNVSFKDFKSIEREIIVNYYEETHTLSVIGDFDGIVLESSIPPEPLPSLKLLVGPINGEDDVLKGISVELLFGTKTISTENTDEYGIATFSFDTPPKDGHYVLRITAKDYYEMNITIRIQYNQEFHELVITGDITDIDLIPIPPPEPPKPPEPVDDPDYYKGFDAYKELEGAREQPVDVEGMLDENRDGTPEYYVDIESELDQDVQIEEYLSFDDNGDPEYSPEINGYEPLDKNDYLSRQSRSNNAGGSGSRSGPSNLTHYEDMINQSVLLYDGSQDVIKYDTQATNLSQAQEFSEEVTSVQTILNNSFKAGYINGSNQTDANNDGNPERLVVWNVSYKQLDRNNDNKTDRILAAVIIYELIDNNSNGFIEHSTGFFAALNASDNDYNGTFEEVIIVVVLGEEKKLDVNFTENYTKLGIFYNHTIDKNNDSNYEFQRAAIYTKQAFDNNSNGNQELKFEFAGGFEGIDNNSNGKYEKALLIWGGSIKIDTKDNGNENINMTTLWIYYVEDQNEDKKLETATGLTHTKWSFDNNSNGNPELYIEAIAGIHLVDSDSDGKLEKVDVVKAMGIFYDKNDDGIMDSNISCALVFLVTDKNEDTNPEFIHALFYCEWNFDNNSNGNPEWSRKAITGFILKDNNSDGKYNELFAVHYSVNAFDTNDNGSVNLNMSFAYALHVIDSDDDGNIEYKHALFGYEHKWDNNTDGNYEAVNQMMAGYMYEDDNDDGNVNNESFFILINKTYDWNNDGYPEALSMSLMASKAQYADNGTIIYARNVFIWILAFDNNSNGHYSIMSQLLIGNEGFNGTRNGTKIDWETENVLLIFHVMRDTDDDGVMDKNPIFIKVEKTI